MSKATQPSLAHHGEALRKQCPFPIKETNLEGVYAIPEPPPEFDPHKATAEELIRHGILWRRPTSMDNPALVKAWDRLYSRKWRAGDHTISEMESQLGKTHVLRKPVRRDTDTSWVGQQWAGAVMNGGGPWGIAVGIWDIPTVSRPAEPKGTEGFWNSSSWVGIDGFNTPSQVSNDVLQAGIEQKVDAQGNASYIAWYEWFAPPQPKSPSYIYQTNFNNFQVTPGQQVICLVAYIPLLAIGSQIIWGGLLILGDLTSGHKDSRILFPPPGATFAGNSAEWIMEAPDGGLPTSSLPKFSPVRFTSAGAGGYSKAVGNPEFGDIVNIETTDSPPKMLTSVTTGNDTVTITFIG
jgi:hypothetical protein